MKSILAILSTILIIGGISSAYSESLLSQLEQRVPYDQIQCDEIDHVFISSYITGSYACIHKKVAEEFKIPSFYNVHWSSELLPHTSIPVLLTYSIDGNTNV